MKGFIQGSIIAVFSVLLVSLVAGSSFLSRSSRGREDASRTPAASFSKSTPAVSLALPATTSPVPVESSTPTQTPLIIFTVTPAPTYTPARTLIHTAPPKPSIAPRPTQTPAPRVEPSVTPSHVLQEPVPRPVMLQSMVGIVCNYKNVQGETVQIRGSGVFISAKGYILTNRHLVDPVWATWAYQDNEIDETLKLADCEIRFLNFEKTIGVAEYQSGGIRLDATPYGFLDLSKNPGGLYYDVKAELAYLPDEQGLSEAEKQNLDFAVLRVTSKNPDKYPGNQMPKMTAAPILLPAIPHWEAILKHKKILIPGYAYQEAGANSFQDYRLLTKEGEIMKIYVGDELFTDTPFVVETKIYPDSSGGRSGSPLFYNGYVVGLYQNKAKPQADDPAAYLRGQQTTINAVLRNLVKKLENFSDIFDDINYFEVQ